MGVRDIYWLPFKIHLLKRGINDLKSLPSHVREFITVENFSEKSHVIWQSWKDSK